LFEGKGDLWYHVMADGYLKVITTNGYTKNDGKAVMGRGCAREASLRWPELPQLLGNMLRKNGNHVFLITEQIPTSHIIPREKAIITFPTKHVWWEKSDLSLIERSALEIMQLADNIGGDWKYVIPRPGCGNGGLKWDDVRPVIEPILDERFIVITK